MTQAAFYSEKQLDAITSLSRATRWRMRQSGDFPEPVKISKGRVGYPVSAIDEWVKSRIRGRCMIDTERDTTRLGIE